VGQGLAVAVAIPTVDQGIRRVVTGDQAITEEEKRRILAGSRTSGLNDGTTITRTTTDDAFPQYDSYGS
jgi:hypothetical protein